MKANQYDQDGDIIELGEDFLKTPSPLPPSLNCKNC